MSKENVPRQVCKLHVSSGGKDTVLEVPYTTVLEFAKVQAETTESSMAVDTAIVFKDSRKKVIIAMFAGFTKIYLDRYASVPQVPRLRSVKTNAS